MKHTARLAIMIVSTSATLALVGCGSGRSVDTIVAELKAPTGKVDATSAKAIGPKLEEQSMTSGLPAIGGEREDTRSLAQAASATISCPAGGSISASGNGDANEGHTEAQYSNCCVQADCCFNGSADMFYDMQNTDYSICMDYSLSFNCAASSGEGSASSSGNLDFSGCFSLDTSSLGMVYLIEIDGLTYRVSGSYSGGSGSVEISGVNGSFSCTYTNGSGTCTGTSGSFSF